MYTYSEFVRSATAEEIAIYEKVEAILDTLSDDEVDALIDVIGDYAFSIGSAKRKELREALVQSTTGLGVSVEELETWYWVEED